MDKSRWYRKNTDFAAVHNTHETSMCHDDASTIFSKFEFSSEKTDSLLNVGSGPFGNIFSVIFSFSKNYLPAAQAVGGV